MIMFLLAAMLPAFILFWYVYSRDITPEPKGVVIKGFIYGVIATIASTLISGPLLKWGFFENNPETFSSYLTILSRVHLSKRSASTLKELLDALQTKIAGK